MNENFIIKTISVIHWLNSFGTCGVALKWWTHHIWVPYLQSDKWVWGFLQLGTSKTHMHILYIRTYINLYIYIIYIYIHIHTVYIHTVYIHTVYIYIYICCIQLYSFTGKAMAIFASLQFSRLIVLVHFIFCIVVLGNVDSSKPVTARNHWGDFGALGEV